jgi:hypothetical protein
VRSAINLNIPMGGRQVRIPREFRLGNGTNPISQINPTSLMSLKRWTRMPPIQIRRFRETYHTWNIMTRMMSLRRRRPDARALDLHP